MLDGRSEAHRPTPRPNPATPDHLTGVVARVQEQLRCHASFDRALVTGAERLSGGASRQTYVLSVADAPVADAILQVERSGSLEHALDMDTQARLVAAAGAAGVPVAPVLATSASEETGTRQGGRRDGPRWMVARRVPGETIARRILRDDRYAEARRGLVEEMGAALARLHSLDPASVPSLRPSDPVAEVEAILAGLGVPSPTFELALRWLGEHRPAELPPVVVHGDFRLGNLIVDEAGLAAVLDWELAHLGDPREDLGWLCVKAWRFGADAPVAGLGEVEALLEAYESHGGTRVEPDALRWWTLAGTLRWGAVCMLQAHAHRSGEARSVELAAIGRRVCQTELDALELLGLLEGGVNPPETSARPPSDLHDLPTVAELLDAVGEWLTGEVVGMGGGLGFQARIAANVVAIARREIELGLALEAAHEERLRALGVGSSRDLAEGIRAGIFDEGNPDLHEALVADVLAKLAVSDPDHHQTVVHRR